jgi:hypothetical protein
VRTRAALRFGTTLGAGAALRFGTPLCLGAALRFRVAWVDRPAQAVRSGGRAGPGLPGQLRARGRLPSGVPRIGPPVGGETAGRVGPPVGLGPLARAGGGGSVLVEPGRCAGASVGDGAAPRPLRPGRRPGGRAGGRPVRELVGFGEPAGLGGHRPAGRGPPVVPAGVAVDVPLRAAPARVASVRPGPPVVGRRPVLARPVRRRADRVRAPPVTRGGTDRVRGVTGRRADRVGGAARGGADGSYLGAADDGGPAAWGGWGQVLDADVARVALPGELRVPLGGGFGGPGRFAGVAPAVVAATHRGTRSPLARRGPGAGSRRSLTAMSPRWKLSRWAPGVPVESPGPVRLAADGG